MKGLKRVRLCVSSTCQFNLCRAPHIINVLSIIRVTVPQGAGRKQVICPLLSFSIQLAVVGHWRCIVLCPVGVVGLQELLLKAFIYR